MKLLTRLFVTLSIFAMLIAAAWIALPAGLTAFARYQLEQLGFTDVALEIDSIGLQSSRVSYVQLSNEDVSLRAQGLQLSYQALALLRGELESIDLDQLDISLKEATSKSGQAVLPDPAILSVIFSTPVVELIPVSSFSVSDLLVYAADGQRMLSALGAIQKQGQQALHGEFQLLDSKLDTYRLQLESSPETGLNFELYPSPGNGTPLALLTLNKNDQDEVTGLLNLDLAAISVLLDIPALLSGALKADIRYSTKAKNSSNSFALKLDGHSLLISGWQLNRLTAQVSGEISSEESRFKLVFEQGSEMQAETIAQEGMHLAKLRLKLPGDISIAQNSQQFTASNDAVLQLEGLMLDGLSIPMARLSDIGVNLRADAKAAEQCTFNALLELPSLTMDSVQLELAQVQLEGICPAVTSTTTSAWEMKALTESLAYEDAEIRVPLYQCQLKLGNSEQGKLLDEDPAELAGRFDCESTDLSGNVSVAYRLHALNGVGRAEFSVEDIRPDDTQPLFASVFKQWEQPFEIVSGDIHLEGVYRWWKSGSGKHREKLAAKLIVHEAGGHYEGILFSGLNYQDSIELLPKLDSGELSALSVSNIDIGLPVTEFRTMIGLKVSTSGILPVVTMEDSGLSVLQGRIRMDPLRMDMNLVDQDLMLNIEGLDLQKIIAMQQLEGLSASGLIDGHMPVTLSADGVNIIDGKINARAPGGHIQYVPEGAADISGAAPGTELLMNILKDLNYHALLVDVNYADDGEMDMQLSIKGLSPKVDKNRPVHFNLNLQQNLLTLLQSLRYVEGIDDRIDQDVQDYFNKRKN